ncbi:hypothetical protein MKEN_00574800 [Mycena kentingensis (nom. inval.)]|nr:hypothetical protein MKEN_00574800 [Mycena kentingensis (nom. inval.)]
MSAQPTPAFNPHTTLGALFLGVVVSCILYGVTNTQTYIYLCRFPQDKPAIKATVAAIWAMETAHVICVIHAVYVWTISAYGHPEALLGRAPASLITSFLLHYLIGVVVQIFFSIRIYRLSTHPSCTPIAYFLWLTALARLVMGCYVCALGFAAPSFVALPGHRDRVVEL